MQNYADNQTHLKAFFASLPETNINFLFFFATDVTKPCVKSRFRKFKLGKDYVYICQGNSDTFYHVYKTSSLRYIVKAPQIISKHLKSVTIESINTKGEVYHGEHITFGITYDRNANSVIVKSHKTKYDLVNTNYNFKRNADTTCNFYLPSNDAVFYDNLIHATCYKKHAVNSTYVPVINHGKPVTMRQMYTETSDVDIIHRLSRALLEPPKTGGMRRRPDYTKINGVKHKVLQGPRGGKYVLINGKKNYLQKGGGVNYKELTFLSDAFVEFIRISIVVPMQNIHGNNLASVQLFFDEGNELDVDSNSTITLLYEFTNKMSNIFYVKTPMLLAACFASTSVSQGVPLQDLEPYEREQYEEFQRTLAPKPVQAQ